MNDAGLMTKGATIQGTVAPGYERVREVFAQGFARDDAYRELGAAIAVYREGRCVVDLWGGWQDRARTRAWQRDTLINVYSTSKGLAATAFAMLVEEGRVRYEDLVTRHWPEFGAAGKATTTVAQLLSHQAGLTGLAVPTTIEQVYDWTGVCRKLAEQAPFWAPGTQTSYHALTWGFLVGEVFRRVAGETIGTYLGRRIRLPLKADVYIGLPAGEEPRVAQMCAPILPPDLSALTQPQEALMALVNPQLDPEIPNTRAWRAAEIPAANGQASAQGIARVYAAIANGGTLDGVHLLAPRTIERMTQRQAERTDLLLGFTHNWAMGYTFNQFNMLGPDPQTFGHGGWGGSIGCANLGKKLAIGYVCNQMGGQLVGDPREMALCEAVFACM